MGRDIVELLSDICTPQRGFNLHTLEQVLSVAIEIAREGREGRKIGTMFVMGFTWQHPIRLVRRKR